MLQVISGLFGGGNLVRNHVCFIGGLLCGAGLVRIDLGVINAGGVLDRDPLPVRHLRNGQLKPIIFKDRLPRFGGLLIRGLDLECFRVFVQVKRGVVTLDLVRNHHIFVSVYGVNSQGVEHFPGSKIMACTLGDRQVRIVRNHHIHMDAIFQVDLGGIFIELYIQGDKELGLLGLF